MVDTKYVYCRSTISYSIIKGDRKLVLKGGHLLNSHRRRARSIAYFLSSARFHQANETKEAEVQRIPLSLFESTPYKRNASQESVWNGLDSSEEKVRFKDEIDDPPPE